MKTRPHASTGPHIAKWMIFPRDQSIARGTYCGVTGERRAFQEGPTQRATHQILMMKIRMKILSVRQRSSGYRCVFSVNKKLGSAIAVPVRVSEKGVLLLMHGSRWCGGYNPWHPFF